MVKILYCVVTQISIPPPPQEGTFVLDPPPPGISVIFQLGWVSPGKSISVKNAVAPYFYAKDNCFYDEERKRSFFCLFLFLFLFYVHGSFLVDY